MWENLISLGYAKKTDQTEHINKINRVFNDINSNIKVKYPSPNVNMAKIAWIYEITNKGREYRKRLFQYLLLTKRADPFEDVGVIFKTDTCYSGKTILYFDFENVFVKQ